MTNKNKKENYFLMNILITKLMKDNFKNLITILKLKLYSIINIYINLAYKMQKFIYLYKVMFWYLMNKFLIEKKSINIIVHLNKKIFRKAY